MKKIIALALSGALAISSAAAQNNQLSGAASPVSNPSTPLSDFSVESVGQVLSELGVAWQSYTTDNGQPFIDANFAGAVNFRIVPTACSGAGYSDCVGLSMLAGFTGQANPQTVNAFNYRYAFASAGLDPSGAAYLSRYEISDYGMPRGNLATSVLVFVQQAALFADELASARRTVSLEGYADDLAASSLNRMGREAITGTRDVAANPIELHQQGIEALAEQTRRFISDKAAPKNKIENFRKE
ncbi:MAG: YbjN domain-containing protein [Hyphococcus sp.]